MTLLIVKPILFSILFFIFLHGYSKTKLLIKKTLGYPLFYIGTVLTSLGLFFIDDVKNLLLIGSGLFVGLLGIGLIIRNIKLLSIRDFLTGLYTRVYFYNEWLPKEMKRQERINGQITFVMMDIDGFKILNDNYGHKFGDHVLKEASKVILNNIRATDIAVRFGGDEILLALPSTSLQDAKKVLNRITESLKDIKLKDSQLLTLSTGMATWRSNEDIDKVLHEADVKMYRHKKIKRVIGIPGENHTN